MGKRHIPGNLRHRGKKKSVDAAAAVPVACFVLLVILIGAAFGRYQRQLRSDGSVRAKEFYFTSDFLDGGTHTLAPGSTEVKFTLGNHADELRFSEMDISYEVDISYQETAGSGATETNGNGATVTKPTGTLNKGSVQDEEVTVSNLKAGTYVITAVGTGGYSKTLTAKIVVPEESAQLYYHMENVSGEYILLTVWNEGDEQGSVTITYTGIPDNTNPNMTNWTTNGTQTIQIDPHASMVFRFFSGTVTVTDAKSKEPC